MANVTLSAAGRHIEAARDRARHEHSTPNAPFRRWLASYAAGDERSAETARVIADLQARVRTGERRFTWEQMHAR